MSAVAVRIAREMHASVGVLAADFGGWTIRETVEYLLQRGLDAVAEERDRYRREQERAEQPALPWDGAQLGAIARAAQAALRCVVCGGPVECTHGIACPRHCADCDVFETAKPSTATSEEPDSDRGRAADAPTGGQLALPPLDALTGSPADEAVWVRVGTVVPGQGAQVHTRRRAEVDRVAAEIELREYRAGAGFVDMNPCACGKDTCKKCVRAAGRWVRDVCGRAREEVRARAKREPTADELAKLTGFALDTVEGVMLGAWPCEPDPGMPAWVEW